jgi:ribosome-associated toxin RatA of RatAB toxin-antitoxin module
MTTRPSVDRKALAASLVLALLAAAGSVAAATAPEPDITVREADGVYSVGATFTVAAPAAAVRAVLTDYNNIPSFMPDVRRSRVLDRESGYVRVEQHAVASFMLFSKDIHLVLMIEEGPETLRFGDTAGTSFRLYEGSWSLTPTAEGTTVAYALNARPSFSVPGFVLRRLLDRDARVMIDRLRIEIAARVMRAG